MIQCPPPEWNEARPPTEQEKLESYLEGRFAQLGFNEFQAYALIRARADWQQAERMLEDGCSRLQAIDILT